MTLTVVAVIFGVFAIGLVVLPDLQEHTHHAQG